MDKQVLVNYIMRAYIPKKKINYKHIFSLLILSLVGLVVYNYRYDLMNLLNFYFNI